MKRTAAIVVTYNRKELLKENIEKLLAQSFKSRLDIIIIDNASTDGTKEYVGSFIDKKEIKYINTGENLGAQAVSITVLSMQWKTIMISFGTWMTIACLKKRLWKSFIDGIKS